LEKHSDWLGPVPFDDAEDLEKSRSEFEKLFGRYGEKSWVTRSLHAVLEEIEQLWEDETRRKQELWGYYALGHRINNLKLHSSATSPTSSRPHDGTRSAATNLAPAEVARSSRSATSPLCSAIDAAEGSARATSYCCSPGTDTGHSRSPCMPCGSWLDFTSHCR